MQSQRNKQPKTRLEKKWRIFLALCNGKKILHFWHVFSSYHYLIKASL